MSSNNLPDWLQGAEAVPPTKPKRKISPFWYFFRLSLFFLVMVAAIIYFGYYRANEYQTVLLMRLLGGFIPCALFLTLIFGGIWVAYQIRQIRAK